MKHVLSIEKLLAVIAFIGTLTLGLFGWDAERAIARLDQVSLELNTTSAHVEQLSAVVDRLDHTSGDHEHRITVIEATR